MKVGCFTFCNVLTILIPILIVFSDSNDRYVFDYRQSFLAANLFCFLTFFLCAHIGHTDIVDNVRVIARVRSASLPNL